MFAKNPDHSPRKTNMSRRIGSHWTIVREEPSLKKPWFVIGDEITLKSIANFN